MSKLYDVISRLEDVSVQGEKGFECVFPDVVQKPGLLRPHWIRMLFFACGFVILGAITIVLTGWWQDRLAQKRSPGLSSRPAAVAKVPAAPLALAELPIEVPAPTVPPAQLQGLTQSSATDAEELSVEILNIDVAETAETLETIDYILQTANLETPPPATPASSQNNSIYIRELEIAEAEPQQEQISENLAALTGGYTQIDEDKARTSRWLHQAELYRRSGEWEGAIVLYQRVWDSTGDPRVANNLAASLIATARFEEALQLLEECSIIAPNDPDINLNLSIVTRILDRQ